MKKLFIITIIAFWTVFFWVPFSIRAGNGQAMGSLKYNTETVENLTGNIMEVQTVHCKMGRVGQGIHLLLKTDGELITVHLGPERFFTKQKLILEEKDAISITGSRVKIAGEDAILAAKLVKNNEDIIIRDDSGLPMWRGSGNKRRRN